MVIIRDVMTENVIQVHPKEPVPVAARLLSHYNVGALPVCGENGVCGMVTDRDIALRCVAAGRNPEGMRVEEIMTTRVVTAGPELTVQAAAELMAREQVCRLPVQENGRLCGMISLGDVACRSEYAVEATEALAEISSNISRRS